MAPAQSEQQRHGVPRPTDLAWLAGATVVKHARDRYGLVHPRKLLVGLGMVYVVLPFGVLVLAGFSLIGLMLVHACVAVCLWLTWRAHRYHRDGRVWESPHYALAATILTGLAYLPISFGQYRLGSLWAIAVTLGWLELLGRQPRFRKQVGQPKWTDHDVLVPNLVASGGFKTVQGVAPRIRYIGQAGRQDSAGEWVEFTVPEDFPPHTIREFDKPDIKAKLAARMGIPRERLHVEEGDRADRIRICKLNERATEATPAVIPDRADWRRPVELGCDELGRPVQVQTQNVHTVLAGATGSGKTNTARYIAMHALLDPTVPLYVISGKDDQKDWRAMAPLCVRYAGGADEGDIQGMVQVLRDVHSLSESRKDEEDPDPVLLIVDEWFLLRNNATEYGKQYVEDLDSLFARLAASSRSRGVHIMLLAQRGTADYIPKTQRANFTQKLCGMVEEAGEAQYVLDSRPEFLCSEPGEFFVKRAGKRPVRAFVPYLDDEAFRLVCDRAADLRSDVGALPDAPPPRLELVSATGPSDLETAVWRALGGGPLKARDVLEGLPEHLRPAGVQVLGRDLTRMVEEGMLRKVNGGPAGNVRMYARAPGSPWGIHLPAGKLPAEPGFSAAQTPATGTDGLVPAVLADVP